MRFQRFRDRYIVRIQTGESALGTLASLLRDEGIAFASVSGAGAVSSVELAYWNPDRREYERRDFDEQLEVVSFQGNASLKDGQPFLHLHGVFGRSDYTVIGGHIQEAVVHPTLEVWLRTEDVDVVRAKDRESGLDLLDLPDRI